MYECVHERMYAYKDLHVSTGSVHTHTHAGAFPHMHKWMHCTHKNPHKALHTRI